MIKYFCDKCGKEEYDLYSIDFWDLKMVYFERKRVCKECRNKARIELGGK
jgi:hypothetical protein